MQWRKNAEYDRGLVVREPRCEMAVSWYAVVLLAATVLGASIAPEKQALENSTCGRVWLTVHSPEIRQNAGRRLLDALELNWDFNGCSNVPRQIGLFESRPSSWANALEIHQVNSADGFVVTEISLGEATLPGAWLTGPGQKGPQCLWPWIAAGDNEIQAHNCLKIQPTWMEDHA
ncbi:uncharacterized protein LOC114357470 [Ostrinia furnacalis]|uniref:uncharacterized protein LOC114357470 n=1 Tax=Ostrinia furnacalis TaxID=93504 RepID=UPI00103DE855|nr:uncharacterized protein LOC114357470 [Ostrinia furnacalis]